MKLLSFLLLTMALVLFVGCDAEDAPPMEGWSPEACAEKSSNNCGIDWFFTFPKAGFPANAQILINKKVVIDECVANSRWAVTETALVVEFELNDFSNLDGTQKVDLEVYDRKNCNQEKTFFMGQIGQTYVIDSTGGTKKIKVTKI